MFEATPAGVRPGPLLPAGSAAVKLAIAGHPEKDVRLDQVEQLCFAVGRQLDWDALAATIVRRAFDAIGMPAQAGLTVAEVAPAYDLDARELDRSVRRRRGPAHRTRPAAARLTRRRTGPTSS